MKQFIRLFVILLALPCVLLLTGCSPRDRSGWSSPGYYGVYDGYRYPRYGYGYGGYPHRHDRPDRPNKPNRPDRPDRPGVKPRPERPSIQPASGPRSSAGMGRPAGMSRGGRR